MRTALTLCLLALFLLPLAAAAPPKPEVPESPIEAGPCVVGWSYFWPGESVGARCDVAGTEVGASHGTCALGSYTWVRVGSTTLYSPCDSTPL